MGGKVKLTDDAFWRVKATLSECELIRLKAQIMLDEADRKTQEVFMAFGLERNKKYKLDVESKEITEVEE